MKKVRGSRTDNLKEIHAPSSIRLLKSSKKSHQFTFEHQNLSVNEQAGFKAT